MFLSEISSNYYLNISEISKIFFKLKYINANATFQVYIDLCLFRRWKNVRILYQSFLKQYIIIAENPKKKKKNIEFFFPTYFDVKIIPEISQKFLKLLSTPSLVKFSKKLNLAFVDQDSTVVYYCIVFNIHKIFGPFL
nr:tRNA-splicing endonuclease subunit Sen15-like [Cryptomonas curvata]